MRSVRDYQQLRQADTYGADLQDDKNRRQDFMRKLFDIDQIASVSDGRELLLEIEASLLSAKLRGDLTHKASIGFSTAEIFLVLASIKWMGNKDDHFTETLLTVAEPGILGLCKNLLVTLYDMHELGKTAKSLVDAIDLQLGQGKQADVEAARQAMNIYIIKGSERVAIDKIAELQRVFHKESLSAIFASEKCLTMQINEGEPFVIPMPRISSLATFIYSSCFLASISAMIVFFNLRKYGDEYDDALAFWPAAVTALFNLLQPLIDELFKMTSFAICGSRIPDVSISQQNYYIQMRNSIEQIIKACVVNNQPIPPELCTILAGIYDTQVGTHINWLLQLHEGTVDTDISIPIIRQNVEQLIKHLRTSERKHKADAEISLKAVKEQWKKIAKLRAEIHLQIEYMAEKGPYEQKYSQVKEAKKRFYADYAEKLRTAVNSYAQAAHPYSHTIKQICNALKKEDIAGAREAFELQKETIRSGQPGLCDRLEQLLNREYDRAYADSDLEDLELELADNTTRYTAAKTAFHEAVGRFDRLRTVQGREALLTQAIHQLAILETTASEDRRLWVKISAALERRLDQYPCYRQHAEGQLFGFHQYISQQFGLMDRQTPQRTDELTRVVVRNPRGSCSI